MTDPNAYVPGESPYLEYVYNNQSEPQPVYWPLFYTQLEYNKDGSILYNDNPEEYFTYSGGWNNLFVSKQKDGRYKNLTIRAYSGDSFYFYFGAGSLLTGDSTYYAGPLTTSGVYSVLTVYSGEQDAIDNKILFTAPNNNTTVFTLPEISVLNFIDLYHHEAVSGESYRLYQFLPRTLIQVDDLEADVIDAVTIRVSDSIVIGPDLIGDKTILGQKIVDGTVSGILLTNGTITGSKIQANTISGALITAGAITADKLDVVNLAAVSTSTGSLTVSGTITVSGVDSRIDAGLTVIDGNGVSIGNFSTVPTVVDSLRIYGSGSSGDIIGMAMYNSTFSTTSPMFELKLDGGNAIEFENNQSSQGVINFNFPSGSTETAVNVYNGTLAINTGNLDIKNGDLFVYNSAGSTIVASIDKSGIIAAGNGSASAPSLTFNNSTDMGLFRVSATAVGFSVSGSEGMRLTPNALTINGTNTNGQLTVEVPDGTNKPALTLRQLSDSYQFINFVGSSSAGTTTPVTTAALGSYVGKVRISINGVTRWIPFYN